MIRRRLTLRSPANRVIFVGCVLIVLLGFFARPTPRHVAPGENGVVQIPLPGETMESFVKPDGCKTVQDIHVVLWWKREDRPYDFFSPDLFGVPYAVNRYCKKACVRYVSTRNRSKIAEADMVVFNFDFFFEFSKEMPPKPRRDIVYVYSSMENTNSIPRPRRQVGTNSTFSGATTRRCACGHLG